MRIADATAGHTAKDHDDYGAELGALTLVNGRVWGIKLPDGSLFREPGDSLSRGDRPATWDREIDAQGHAAALLTVLEQWYGIDTAHPANDITVVPLAQDAAGNWQAPGPDRFSVTYRPIDPDTDEPSWWPCAARPDDLTVPQARRVMREHRECAGLLPCTIRGRARAVLVRAGVMVLSRHGAAAWSALSLPDGGR